MENLKKLFPRLSDLDMERLLKFGEGMAVKAEEYRQTTDSTPQRAQPYRKPPARRQGGGAVEPEKRKPGVMLYFDKMRPIFTLLSAEERGELIMKILDYGEFDREPDFVPGDHLESLWPSIRKAIDRDAEAYQKKCKQRRKAIQARWERERSTKQQDGQQSEGRI